MEQFWKRGEGSGKESWALGWKMENNIVSRTSKTGCSISIDLEKELIILVLSNQQHIDPNSNVITEISSEVNSIVRNLIT